MNNKYWLRCSFVVLIMVVLSSLFKTRWAALPLYLPGYNFKLSWRVLVLKVYFCCSYIQFQLKQITSGFLVQVKKIKLIFAKQLSLYMWCAVLFFSSLLCHLMPSWTFCFQFRTRTFLFWSFVFIDEIKTLICCRDVMSVEEQDPAGNGQVLWNRNVWLCNCCKEKWARLYEDSCVFLS